MPRDGLGSLGSPWRPEMVTQLGGAGYLPRSVASGPDGAGDAALEMRAFVAAARLAGRVAAHAPEVGVAQVGARCVLLPARDDAVGLWIAAVGIQGRGRRASARALEVGDALGARQASIALATTSFRRRRQTLCARAARADQRRPLFDGSGLCHARRAWRRSGPRLWHCVVLGDDHGLDGLWRARSGAGREQSSASETDSAHWDTALVRGTITSALG